jgi:hypothetical protein
MDTEVKLLRLMNTEVKLLRLMDTEVELRTSSGHRGQVSKVIPSSLIHFILIMEATRSSETWNYIPEDFILHIHTEAGEVILLCLIIHIDIFTLTAHCYIRCSDGIHSTRAHQ